MLVLQVFMHEFNQHFHQVICATWQPARFQHCTPCFWKFIFFYHIVQFCCSNSSWCLLRSKSQSFRIEFSIYVTLFCHSQFSLVTIIYLVTTQLQCSCSGYRSWPGHCRNQLATSICTPLMTTSSYKQFMDSTNSTIFQVPLRLCSFACVLISPWNCVRNINERQGDCL